MMLVYTSIYGNHIHHNLQNNDESANSNMFLTTIQLAGNTTINTSYYMNITLSISVIFTHDKYA
jgi:hypothetical protein